LNVYDIKSVLNTYLRSTFVLAIISLLVLFSNFSISLNFALCCVNGSAYYIVIITLYGAWHSKNISPVCRKLYTSLTIKSVERWFQYYISINNYPIHYISQMTSRTAPNLMTSKMSDMKHENVMKSKTLLLKWTPLYMYTEHYFFLILR
jgi:hypothetical protein